MHIVIITLKSNTIVIYIRWSYTEWLNTGQSEKLLDRDGKRINLRPLVCYSEANVTYFARWHSYPEYVFFLYCGIRTRVIDIMRIRCILILEELDRRITYSNQPGLVAQFLISISVKLLFSSPRVEPLREASPKYNTRVWIIWSHYIYHNTKKTHMHTNRINWNTPPPPSNDPSLLAILYNKIL